MLSVALWVQLLISFTPVSVR